MKKHLKALLKAYLDAYGRYPMSIPLAGSVVAVYPFQHAARHDARRPQRRDRPQRPIYRFDPFGWPDVA
ncbi:MAG: hypothetical protein HKN49_11135 [Gammaproteobacteria bacterium]|nr:hypothetical protein [Gammaproteobacteria bacterium]